MIKLGLTGNLGSGKTSVAKVFESFGFKIFYADDNAKYLYKIPSIKTEIESLLNTSISTYNGEINYKLIADKYFFDSTIYKKINEILYPVLQKKIKTETELLSSNVIVEAAMLFEIGLESFFDYIITVSTPLEERMNRVFKRNGFEKDEFMIREDMQSDPLLKEAKSDFIIYNNEQSSVIEQVNDILNKINY